MQLAPVCREIRMRRPADVTAAAAARDSLSIAHCAPAASDKFIYAVS